MIDTHITFDEPNATVELQAIEREDGTRGMTILLFSPDINNLNAVTIEVPDLGHVELTEEA